MILTAHMFTYIFTSTAIAYYIPIISPVYPRIFHMYMLYMEVSTNGATPMAGWLWNSSSSQASGSGWPNDRCDRPG